MQTAWSNEEFKNQLMALGKYYHIHHPYNIALNSGKLSRSQIQEWVANRFYYQRKIPIKDACILANCPDQNVRREWIKRIMEHDGQENSLGGIEAWLRLGEACGLTRTEILAETRVIPGVRFAVDAYVHFVRCAPWQEAVCASLTELFAPQIHQERLTQWPMYYSWIKPEGLEYFRKRLQEAPKDVEFALKQTQMHFRTLAEQQRALQIVKFKLNVLWEISEAMFSVQMIGC